MTANETNKQEVYNGIKDAMLKEGAIPQEIIKREQESIEIKRIQKQLNTTIGEPAGEINNALKALTQKYPTLTPITTPIKIIAKRIDRTFTIIDYVLEYQINGEEGVLVKIGEEVISNAVFAAGTSVSIVISSAVAAFVSGLSGSPQLGAIVGFVVFSGGVVVSNWLGDKSKEVVHFIYEYVYLPTKSKVKSLQNGLDYFVGGDFSRDYQREFLLNNDMGRKYLEYELRNRYGDDEVDDMDEFEKNYRMRFNK